MKIKEYKPKLSEHAIQSQIVQYLRFNKIECFAVPNGIFFNSSSKSKSYAYIKKLHAEGFRNGTADIVVLFYKRIVFIEVKAVKGVQSDSQKEFEQMVKNLGFEYYIWRDVDDCIEFIKQKGD